MILWVLQWELSESVLQWEPLELVLQWEPLESVQQWETRMERAELDPGWEIPSHLRTRNSTRTLQEQGSPQPTLSN